MLSLAIESDAEEVLNYMIMFSRETRHHDSLDIDKLRGMVNSWCANQPNPSRLCLLWKNDGVIVGAIVGIALELPFCSYRRTAELAFHVKPKFRTKGVAEKLIEAYEYWAKLSGCTQTQLMAPVNGLEDKLGKFYSRLGYKEVERAYLKDLDRDGSR